MTFEGLTEMTVDWRIEMIVDRRIETTVELTLERIIESFIVGWRIIEISVEGKITAQMIAEQLLVTKMPLEGITGTTVERGS